MHGFAKQKYKELPLIPRTKHVFSAFTKKNAQNLLQRLSVVRYLYKTQAKRSIPTTYNSCCAPMSFTTHPPHETDDGTSFQGAFLVTAYRHLQQRLRHLSRSITHNDDEADDALQDAFERLWLRRTHIASEEEAAALITTTVRNLSIDTLRRRAANATESISEQYADTVSAENNDDNETETRFRRVLQIVHSRLSPSQQQILRMRDYEGRDYEKIAQELRLSPTAVRMQLSRARKTVREVYILSTKKSSQS